MMSNLYGGNGSPESINIAEKRGTYVSPPWHTHEISCVGPLDVRSRELSKARLMSRTTDFRLRFGLRPRGCGWGWEWGVRLFYVKIIVNPQGAATFWELRHRLRRHSLRLQLRIRLRLRIQIFTSSCCTRNVTSLWRFMEFGLPPVDIVAISILTIGVRSTVFFLSLDFFFVFVVFILSVLRSVAYTILFG